MKKNELESLSIYMQYIELMYYTNNITEKYPKTEKLALVTDIKSSTYVGLRYIIYA